MAGFGDAFIGGLGGGLATGFMGAIGQSHANDKNAEMARSNRKWSKYMADSAHEREVKDLRNAGLNPILSATGGAGAAVPPPALAEVENAIEPGLSSALETMRVKKEVAQMESETELNTLQGKLANEAAKREQATAKQVQKQTEQIEALMPAIKAKAAVEAKEAGYDLRTLEPRYMNKLLNEGLGTLNNAKDLVSPKFRPDKKTVPTPEPKQEPWKGTLPSL